MMKKGDLVRFAKWEELKTEELRNSRQWGNVPKRHIGVLVDHDKLMGTTQVLYEGEVISLRSVFVQKAGKKDFEKVAE